MGIRFSIATFSNWHFFPLPFNFINFWTILYIAYCIIYIVYLKNGALSGSSYFTIYDPTIYDPKMYSSCINYVSVFILWRDWCERKQPTAHRIRFEQEAAKVQRNLIPVNISLHRQSGLVCSENWFKQFAAKLDIVPGEFFTNTIYITIVYFGK